MDVLYAVERAINTVIQNKYKIAEADKTLGNVTDQEVAKTTDTAPTSQRQGLEGYRPPHGGIHCTLGDRPS